jgi:hypothetical protein
MIEIPEGKLTRTFRDAIHITRFLDLRYLWIDALCIIQLSKLDWQIEAALMSSVYGGSSSNIAVAGATDGTKGCSLNPLASVATCRSNLRKNAVWDIGPDAFYDSVVKSPLASRAWCLQERLLSPRTLHFSKMELFSECQHCNASESFPDRHPQLNPKLCLTATINLYRKSGIP